MKKTTTIKLEKTLLDSVKIASIRLNKPMNKIISECLIRFLDENESAITM